MKTKPYQLPSPPTVPATQTPANREQTATSAAPEKTQTACSTTKEIVIKEDLFIISMQALAVTSSFIPMLLGPTNPMLLALLGPTYPMWVVIGVLAVQFMFWYNINYLALREPATKIAAKNLKTKNLNTKVKDAWPKIASMLPTTWQNHNDVAAIENIADALGGAAAFFGNALGCAGSGFMLTALLRSIPGFVPLASIHAPVLLSPLLPVTLALVLFRCGYLAHYYNSVPAIKQAMKELLCPELDTTDSQMSPLKKMMRTVVQAFSYFAAVVMAGAISTINFLTGKFFGWLFMNIAQVGSLSPFTMATLAAPYTALGIALGAFSALVTFIGLVCLFSKYVPGGLVGLFDKVWDSIGSFATSIADIKAGITFENLKASFTVENLTDKFSKIPEALLYVVSFMAIVLFITVITSSSTMSICYFVGAVIGQEYVKLTAVCGAAMYFNQSLNVGTQLFGIKEQNQDAIVQLSSVEDQAAASAAPAAVPSAPSLRSLSLRLDIYEDAKKDNKKWLNFYIALALITGIALSGGAIPFFLNTSIPILFFLSKKIVLTVLTAVQIVVWSAIYGQNNSGFIQDSFWRKYTQSTAPDPHDKSTLLNKFKNFVNAYFPSSALSQKFFRKNEKSLNHEIVKFDELVKKIVDGTPQNTAAQTAALKQQIQQYLLEEYGEINSGVVKTALKQLSLTYDNFSAESVAESYTKFEHLSPEDFIAAFKARKAIVDDIKNTDFQVEDKTFDPTDDNKRMLFLTYTHPTLLKIVDVIADTIGVINAIFVNSAGIAVSAIQLLAFAMNLAVKAGIISSPIIPVTIGLTVLSLGLLAGWNAAHNFTRMETRKAFRNIAFNLLSWWHNKKKYELNNYFTAAKSYNMLAFVISIVLSVGFCCFNAATGAILGDTLYKIFVYHNFACITTPAIILNPSIIPATWIGKLLWSFALLLTIPSTGAILFDIERGWISTFTKNITGAYSYCHTQLNKTTPKYWLGLAVSAAVMPICYLAFNALGVIPAIAAFQVALLSLVLPALYLLGCKIDATNHRSLSEIGNILQSNLVIILVLLMTFATAAQLTILTLSSPMWLLILTQPQLRIWAATTGAFCLIGFVSLFNGGLSSVVAPTPSSIPRSNIDISALKGQAQSTFFVNAHSSGTDYKPSVNSQLFLAGPCAQGHRA